MSAICTDDSRRLNSISFSDTFSLFHVFVAGHACCNAMLLFVLATNAYLQLNINF